MIRNPSGRTLALTGAVLVAACLGAVPARAQSYQDSGGTAVPGYVPLAGCAAGARCTGPAYLDPCANSAKTNIAISTSAGNLQLAAPAQGKKVYVCSLVVIGANAWVGSLIEGTGSSCTTANEAADLGSTTASAGVSLAANYEFTYGNGAGTVIQTATAGNGLCLLQNGTVALAGNIMIVQQ